MQEYFKVKAGFLVDRYEWSRGEQPSDKILKARDKEVKEGTAVIVTEFTSSNQKSKVSRKG